MDMFSWGYILLSLLKQFCIFFHSNFRRTKLHIGPVWSDCALSTHCRTCNNSHAPTALADADCVCLEVQLVHTRTLWVVCDVMGTTAQVIACDVMRDHFWYCRSHEIGWWIERNYVNDRRLLKDPDKQYNSQSATKSLKWRVGYHKCVL